MPLMMRSCFFRTFSYALAPLLFGAAGEEHQWFHLMFTTARQVVQMGLLVAALAWGGFWQMEVW